MHDGMLFSLALRTIVLSRHNLKADIDVVLYFHGSAGYLYRRNPKIRLLEIH